MDGTGRADQGVCPNSCKLAIVTDLLHSTIAMDDSRSDEALMLAYQQHDQQAFAALYQRYRQPLYAYLLRSIGNKSQAEEVYQEVWLSLIKQRQRYVASAGFRSYIFCIAHSRLLDFYRQQGKLSANDSLDDHDEAQALSACTTYEPEARFEEARLLERLQFCLRQLPEEQRAVLLLKLESELTLQAIASQLDVAFEALKSRFRYAQAKLQRCLGGEA